MNTYHDSLKVKEALPLYFSRYHFKDGGYHSTWFKIKLGPVYMPMPNIKMRVDAVKLHDLHHLVTEYEATMKGEIEIGAWEIASGCGKYPAAWILNFGSFFYGMIFHPRCLLRAFLKGRKCATNLYHDSRYDDALLNQTIGELRRRIVPDPSIKNSILDYLIFIFCSLFSLSAAFLFFAIAIKLITFIF